MIGVLALQGAFQKHCECLAKLSVSSKLVRHSEELNECTGLIMPGGETTTHLRLIKQDFWNALINFGRRRPIFGTCCGLILLSKEVVDTPMLTFGLINIKASRNAYGSQIESFEERVMATLNQKKVAIKGCFIRAPKVMEIGPGVSVLARHEGFPVIVEDGRHLASSFHPEVSMDLALHEYFIQKVKRT